MHHQDLRRFVRFSTVGFGTFLLDLGLLGLLVRAGVHYLPAAAAAFLAAVSLHYIISRHIVFPGTTRGVRAGYGIFLGIAVGSLLLITGSLAVLVGMLGLPLLSSRVLIAAVAGVWNFLMNAHVNFRITGV